MQDFPDFESYLQDQSSHARKRAPRSGVERIPEFDQTATVTLEIEVLKETYDQILEAIIANEWEREEGLRTVLLTGLGYLDASLNRDEIKQQATANAEGEAGKRVDTANKETLSKQIAAYHSMYSVMKFKAYKLYKTNQTLEFNIAGLRETERMWEGWADRMRREHASLQTECIRLRALMSEFKLDWDHAPLGNVEVAAQVEQSAITTPLIPSILSDFSPEVPLELPSPEPPLTRLSLWERCKNFLRGR